MSILRTAGLDGPVVVGNGLLVIFPFLRLRSVDGKTGIVVWGVFTVMRLYVRIVRLVVFGRFPRSCRGRGCGGVYRVL